MIQTLGLISNSFTRMAFSILSLFGRLAASHLHPGVFKHCNANRPRLPAHQRVVPTTPGLATEEGESP